MNAKERVLDGFEVFGMTRVNAKIMYKHLISAVKDEIIPKDQSFQEFFGLGEKPKLIQGYTAEQWQEIKKGGYLCEFSGEKGWTVDTLDKIPSAVENPKDVRFKSKRLMFSSMLCRPAQIKGVMRPIFVEPVDKEAMCAFFNEGGYPLGNKLQLSLYRDYTEGYHQEATKYIEL